MRLPLQFLNLIQAVAFLVGTLTFSPFALADTYTVFNVSGSTQNGAAISGTMTLDIGSGIPYFSTADITVSAPDSERYGAYAKGTACGWIQGQPDVCSVIFADKTDYYQFYIFISVPGGDLTKYTGGSIIPTIQGVGYNSSLSYPDQGITKKDDISAGYIYTISPACSDLYSGSAVKLVVKSPQITAKYVPKGGVSLKDAASICGFIDFDWQQKIVLLPPPNPFRANLNPTVTLVAPPAFLDPPFGGYTYLPDVYSFPFYYRAQNDITGEDSVYNLNAHEKHDAILGFLDEVMDPTLPSGDAISIVTSLVGVLPGYSASKPLVTFSWNSTFNGKSGGVTILKGPH